MPTEPCENLRGTDGEPLDEIDKPRYQCQDADEVGELCCGDPDQEPICRSTVVCFKKMSCSFDEKEDPDGIAASAIC